MGADSFVVKDSGRSVSEVFNKLVEDAVYEFGNDCYNGTIATCDLGRCIKSFDTYDKDNETFAKYIIKEHHNGVKGRADYIDLGVCGYEEVTIKRTKMKVDIKTETRYGVFDEVCEKLVHRDAHFETPAEAEAFAKEWSKKGCDCNIVKFKRKISGNDIIVKYTTETKRTEKKPRKKKNTEIYPIHRYVFYGYASC